MKWSGVPVSLRIFQFVVIHIVNEAELDVFVEFLCFLYDSVMLVFDIWFFCLFKMQLVPIDILGSHTPEPSLKDFEYNLSSI